MGNAYSLAPASIIESLSINAASKIKDPRVKAGMFTRMLEKLGNLKRDRDEIGIAFGKGYKRKAIEDQRKASVVGSLRSVLTNAIFLRSERPDQREHGANIEAYNKMAVPAQIDGEEVVVFISLRQDNNGNFVYDGRVLEIETPADGTQTSTAAETEDSETRQSDVRQAREEVILDHLEVNKDLTIADSFSLRPVAMIDALQVNAASKIKDPRVKAGMFTRMLEKLGNLKRDRDEIGIAFGKGYRRKAIEDPRKTAGIRKEAAMREALRREELEDEAHARHGGILHGDDLSKLWNNPVWQRIANPDDKLHGRLLSLAAWKRRNPGESVGAEYDGSGDIPRVAFGGEINPAEMAQELYDAGLIPHPTPDALWSALKREAASVEKIKQMMDASR